MVHVNLTMSTMPSARAAVFLCCVFTRGARSLSFNFTQGSNMVLQMVSPCVGVGALERAHRSKAHGACASHVLHASDSDLRWPCAVHASPYMH